MRLDLFHLVRSLRRSPISAAAAMLTLALTIGVGASIFAVADAVLLTPPPIVDPDAVFVAGETRLDEPPSASRAVAYDRFEAWRDRARSLATLEAFDGTFLTLTGLGAAERLNATDVTPAFLRLIGVVPSRGRLFAPDDTGQAVIVVSDRFWRGRLAADPNVIGRQVILGGRPHVIVGVLPAAFESGFGADVWRPIEGRPRVRVVARLAGSGSGSQLAAVLDEVSRTSSPPFRAVATPVAAVLAGPNANTVAFLGAAAALTMLIAFANLAGLLMVRSIDRRRELAVRCALGARGSEVVRQLLLEVCAVIAIGMIGGVVLAVWITPAFAQIVMQQLGPVANRATVVSWRVIGLVAMAACLCAALCVSVPALAAARWKVVDVLRRGVTASHGELTLRRALVAGEVAAAFVLLVSMALLGRTLLAVLHVNPGFDARGVMTLRVALPSATYATDERVASFYALLQQALEERLGRHAVSTVDELPLTHDRGRRLVSAAPSDAPREAVVRSASPDYFAVMRVPVTAGRSFDRQDNASAPARVMLSTSLATRLFGGEAPVGRQVLLAGGTAMAEVIGVVGDVKHRALDETTLPALYVSALQEPSRTSIVVVRSASPDANVIAAVREEAARLDGNLAVYGVQPLAASVAASPGMPARRLLTTVFAGFAFLAVVLSAIGLFGVIAHDVSRRRAELALRVALGAAPMRLLRSTLAQGSVMIGGGLAVGALLSIGASRALSGLAFTTFDSSALSVGIAATVIVMTGFAAILPAAWRAARTDPLDALRAE